MPIWCTACLKLSSILNYAAGRAPQQVADAILDGQLVLAVDGAVGLLEGRGIIQQRLHFELLAVLPGRASLARPAMLVGGVRDGIGPHACDQVVVLLEQAGDDLLRAIVGVGDEVEGLIDIGDADEGDHLVEQGPAVAVGPYHALMDARGKRHSEDGRGGLNEQTYSLQ